jgi:hypothetical protein
VGDAFRRIETNIKKEKCHVAIDKSLLNKKGVSDF